MQSRCGPDPAEELPGGADVTFLLLHGLTAATLAEASRIAEQQRVGIDAVLIGSGAITEDAFYRALAEECGLAFLSDPHVVVIAAPEIVTRAGVAPLRPGRWRGRFSAPRGPAIRPLLGLCAGGRGMPGMALTSPARLEQAVLRASGARIAEAAAHDLPNRDPSRSFRDGVTGLEKLWLYLVVLVSSFWIALHGADGVADGGAVLGLVMMVGLAYRLAAVVDSPTPDPRGLPLVPQLRLPPYTVLVPLFREAGMVKSLSQALARLDYPPALLEVLFLVEADDHDTRAALAALDLPTTQRVVVCPPGTPRTKPRALNVGLALARGDLVVVYDAEDAPATDQLRAAAARFAAGRADLACLQAMLVVRPAPGMLARLFRLEYAAQFAVVMPGLAAMQLPAPLGGTSNHFRRSALVAVGGWDAWNVTEDADIGLRLARLGYRVETLASETLEDPPTRLDQCFPQRVRWLKGGCRRASWPRAG